MFSKDSKKSWTLVKRLSFKELCIYGVTWGIILAYVNFAGKEGGGGGLWEVKIYFPVKKISYLNWLKIFHDFFFSSVTNEQISEEIIDLTLTHAGMKHSF